MWKRLGAALALCLGALVFSSVAYAQAQVSTIHLHDGGVIRGEIAMDVPGKPLLVLIGGQTISVEREQIARIDAPGAAVAPVAPPPVTAAPPPPAQVAPVVVPPPPPTSLQQPTSLRVDRRGQAEVDTTWPVEAQELVRERNRVNQSLRRAGYGGAIILTSFGLVSFIVTTVAWRVVASNQADCLNDIAYGYGTDLEECSTVNTGRIAAVGYPISAMLLAGGTTFFLMRSMRKRRLANTRDRIDNSLRQYNIVPVASVGGSHTGSVLGAAMTGRF